MQMLDREFILREDFTISKFRISKTGSLIYYTLNYLLIFIFFFFQALNFLVESFVLLNDLFPLSLDPGRRLSSF
jgi:hypothetical protein